MDRKLHPKGQFRLSHFSSLSVKNIQQSMYHVFYQRSDSSIIISLCIRKTYSKICETYLHRTKNLSTFPKTIFQSYSNQAKCNTFFYHSMDKKFQKLPTRLSSSWRNIYRLCITFSSYMDRTFTLMYSTLVSQHIIKNMYLSYQKWKEIYLVMRGREAAIVCN